MESWGSVVGCGGEGGLYSGGGELGCTGISRLDGAHVEGRYSARNSFYGPCYHEVAECSVGPCSNAIGGQGAELEKIRSKGLIVVSCCELYRL